MTILLVDKYIPNWGEECERCHRTPCVVGVHGTKPVYYPHLCGVCEFGTLEALDPDLWDDLGE